MRELRTLASRYEAPSEVPCVVFARREDADVWIELLHLGQQEGAGLVDWTAQQGQRHRVLRGAASPPHMQVLDFVLGETTAISAETRKRAQTGKYPVSTLERALTSPYLRERMGIDIDNGRVVTKFPKGEVLKALTKIVDEIGTSKVKVSDFMSKEDRARYADGLASADLPDEKTRGTTAAPLQDAPAQAGGTKRSTNRKASNSARLKMVPSDFSANIQGPPRIEAILRELKSHLKLNDAPNAVAVLYRVFFELSVDDFIGREAALSKYKGMKLYQKVDGVLAYMEANGIVKKRDMQQVRHAVQDPPTNNLTTNLNAFVHNPHMIPSPAELRAVWDSCAPFIQLLWP